MTLVVAAVAPDVIVMGTDSAVSLKMPNVPPELVYSGLKKLFTWKPMNVGVCIFGSFPIHIDKETFSDWMQNWYDKNLGTKTTDPDNLTKLLCADLDKKIPPEHNTPVGLYLAMWVTCERFPGTKIPIVIEINRIRGKYTYHGKVRIKVIELIHEYRMGVKKIPYPIEVFAAGLPNLGAEQMAGLRDLFSKIVRAQVPAASSIHLNEYVRLLITTVARLYATAGLPAYVSEPVEVLHISPESLWGVSMCF